MYWAMPLVQQRALSSVGLRGCSSIGASSSAIASLALPLVARMSAFILRECQSGSVTSPQSVKTQALGDV
jgi:hypothetical protein